MDERYRSAIGTVESDNNYAALGPVTDSGDRAYGRYQVMGANVPEWTQKHLGQRMTPDEFLNNKDAQDRVFDSETSAHFKKYGNLDDVTSTWFSGRPVARAGNSSDGYNTVPQYLSKVNAAYNAPDGPTAIDRAMGRSSTGSQRMAYAEPGALTPMQPPGALNGGPPPDEYGWLGTLGQTLKDMAPGIAQDPAHAVALEAAAAGSRKIAGATGKWSQHIDPKTGIGVMINDLTGQRQQFRAHDPVAPEKTKQEDAYNTQTGKAFGDLNQSIQAGAVTSRAALGNLGTLRSALDNPEVYQGTGGDAIASAKKMGNAFLGMDFKGVADADVAKALINKLTQESRLLNGGMPGSLSDKDLAFLQAANPGLDKSPEANKRIIDIYEKLHNRNIEMNDERLAYTKGGKMLDEGFNQRLSTKWATEHAPANAAYKSEQAAAPAAGTAAPATTSFKTPQGVQWRRN